MVSKMRLDGEVRLRFSKPMVELLETLSIRLDSPVTDMLTQAVALLSVAVEAQARGQRLCLADDDLRIVGEIVDFGAIEGPGVAPFPEIEGDRDDPE